MSGLTDARHRRARPWHVVAIALVLALLALGAGALAGDNNNGPSSYEAARAAYEQTLLNNPNRVDADFGVQIHDNEGGAVYTYEITTLTVRAKDGSLKNECDSRCMVVRKTADGYAVTLPVAFVYRVGEQSFSPMASSRPVTELTYWDSWQHRPVTIRSSGGKAVTLPKVLYGRIVSQIQDGETVYMVPQYIRSDGQHTLVLDQVTVRNEPGGSLYGMMPLARATKDGDGFDVCLPQGYQPIYERGVRGLPARVVSAHC